jgi:spore cortex biosynthesis protein YabQ
MAQLFTFLTSVLCGVGIGVVFGIFRMHRKKYKVNAFFLNFQDILFWLFFTFVVCYFTFYVNDGIFRAYEFLGFGLGMLIYLKILSRLVEKLLTAIWKVFAFLAEWILRISLFPIVLLTPPAKFIWGIIKKILRKEKNKFERNKSRLKRFAKRI